MTVADFSAWLRLRFLLWPNESALDSGMDTILADPDQECFLAIVDDEPVGFIELSLRKYAEGCQTSPVAFVEGWYVSDEYQRQGIGSKLLHAGEAWGRKMGCTELGSDTEVSRTLSRLVHKKLGFEEVEEIVAFRKSL